MSASGGYWQGFVRGTCIDDNDNNRITDRYRGSEMTPPFLLMAEKTNFWSSMAFSYRVTVVCSLVYMTEIYSDERRTSDRL